eukprot:m.88413 g.88413  ORF g.88413 m.88413 type:complete len:147 (+) comp26195_c0_seq1:594-1034(+)
MHEFNMIQDGPTIVREDNQACIKYSETLSVTDRNKYMGRPVHLPSKFPVSDTNMTSRQVRVDYHTIKRAVSEGIAKFEYVDTTNQLADIFTKNLPTRTHATFTSGMLTRIDSSHDTIKSRTQNSKRIADTQLTIKAIRRQRQDNTW